MNFNYTNEHLSIHNHRAISFTLVEMGLDGKIEVKNCSVRLRGDLKTYFNDYGELKVYIKRSERDDLPSYMCKNLAFWRKHILNHHST